MRARLWALTLWVETAQALRVLDNAMDTIIDKPLANVSGWSILERDASGGRLMRWFAHFVYLLRKVRSHPRASPEP